jgi:hypothetical protein
MKLLLFLSITVGLCFGKDTYKESGIKLKLKNTPEVSIKEEQEIDEHFKVENHQNESPRELASEEEAQDRGPSSAVERVPTSTQGLPFWKHEEESSVPENWEYFQFKQKPL